MTSIDLGPLLIRIASEEETFPYESTPASHPDMGVLQGVAVGALITGPGINIDLALVQWPGDAREVKTIDTHAAPSPLDYMSGRTTLFRSEVDRKVVSLMYLEAVAPQKANPSRMSAQQVTTEQLDWILGTSVEELLREHGAIAFGTGEELRGDESKIRNRLQVAFEHDNIAVPLIAFAITRQLALLKGFDKLKWGQ